MYKDLIQAPGDISRKIWALLSTAERRSAIVLLGLMFTGMIFEMLGVGLIIPVMTALMNPELMRKYPGGDWLASILVSSDPSFMLYTVLGIMLHVFSVKALVLAVLAWKQADFTYGLLSAISGRLFKSYLARPYQFHLSHNSAHLVRNAVTETQVFALNVISPAISLIAEVLVLFGICALLLYIEPLGSIIVMLVVGSMALIFHQYSRSWAGRWGAARQLHEGMRIKVLQESLSMAKEIILLDRAQAFTDRYDRHAQISASSAGKQTLVAQLPRLLLEFVAVLGMGALVALQLYRGQTVQQILPVLVVFAAAAFRLMPSVNRVLIALNSLQYGIPVLNVLHSEVGRNEAMQVLVTESIEGPILKCELKNVSMSYPDSERNALDNISLTFSGGEMIGFIGASGAGKSTLVDVVLGLLPPSNGEICINGKEMDLRSSDWKRRLGYVPQSIVLTDDTIRRNVAFGLDDEKIDDAAVWQALRAAQLADFVATLPDSVDTVVGERGVRLSGGQRQRIGVARALYGDPEILVMDEATSALDSATESDVMDAVRCLHGQKTILVVAHRLSTVSECDRLYRMENGRIVQVGSPAQILATLPVPVAVALQAPSTQG